MPNGEPPVSLSLSDYFRLGVAGAFGSPAVIAREVQAPTGGAPLPNIAQGVDIAVQSGLEATGNTRTAQQFGGLVEQVVAAGKDAAAGAGQNATKLLVGLALVVVVVMALKR